MLGKFIGGIKVGVFKGSGFWGKTYIIPGFGDMNSGLDKNIEIANGVCIIAETDYSKILERLDQGFVSKVSNDIEEIFKLVKDYMEKKEYVVIAYHGNFVDLLEYAADNNIIIDLLSDELI